MKTMLSYNRSRGFTLTETLTAIGILSVALLGVVTLYANVFSLLRSDRTLADAAAAAQERMTALSLAPVSAGESRVSKHGITYTVSTSLVPTNNGLLHAEVLVTWETNGGARRYTLATLIDTN